MGRIIGWIALLAAGLAHPSWAQFSAAPRPAEEGIGIADGPRGSFYSVTQRFGNNAYFQITKLALTGAVQWNVPYDPGRDATAAVIALDPDGNVLIAGTIKDNSGKLNVLVTKFTPTGAPFWPQPQIRSAGGYAIPTIMATDFDGNIYVGATVTDQDGSFLQVTRFNPAGALYWEQPYKVGRTNYARTMAIDRNGDAHMTVEVYFGDPRFSTSEVRSVLFTANGAVVPQ